MSNPNVGVIYVDQHGNPVAGPPEHHCVALGCNALLNGRASMCDQFEVPDDSAAVRVTELAIRAICDGLMSPDQDWRSRWRETLLATSEHMRLGTHPNALEGSS
jgi:hypothetical protein